MADDGTQHLQDLLSQLPPMPTQADTNRAMWQHTITIAEASKRVAERQLRLLRAQAEVIGEQMIAEQHKIDRADYDIRTAQSGIAYCEDGGP